jgi:hypothetical protein
MNREMVETRRATSPATQIHLSGHHDPTLDAIANAALVIRTVRADPRSSRQAYAWRWALASRGDKSAA